MTNISSILRELLKTSTEIDPNRFSRIGAISVDQKQVFDYISVEFLFEVKKVFALKGQHKPARRNAGKNPQ
ncbi:MAG: hypothetical protein LBF88_08465 [Planctomycetaceae bacterium]|jgi:hypothetical protein|nr:hypothetical protein [Planctomycetaceae bacterium]